MKMETLEAKTKLGMDWVSENQKEVLREKILKKLNEDTILASTLHNIIKILINCVSEDANRKQNDYALAAAVCKHWGYPTNWEQEFEEYYKKNEPSANEAKRKVEEFLRSY